MKSVYFEDFEKGFFLFPKHKVKTLMYLLDAIEKEFFTKLYLYEKVFISFFSIVSK